MKQRSLIYTLFIFFWLLVDFAVQSLANQRLFGPIVFVSQLHFLALLLMTNIDDRKEIVIKVLIISFIMDLFHYNSFPVFYISYGLSAILVRVWYRHIGSTLVETMVLMALGLFAKEIFLYGSLWVFLGTRFSLVDFLTTRSMIVILGNLVLFPLVNTSFKYIQRQVDSSINNYFR